MKWVNASKDSVIKVIFNKCWLCSCLLLLKWGQEPFLAVLRFLLREPDKDLPGGPVVKTPSANARGHGFDLWSRKILYAARELSPCAQLLKPLAWSPCSAYHSPHPEKSPGTETKSQHVKNRTYTLPKGESWTGEHAEDTGHWSHHTSLGRSLPLEPCLSFICRDCWGLKTQCLFHPHGGWVPLVCAQFHRELVELTCSPESESGEGKCWPR